jgi:hypothetical protein
MELNDYFLGFPILLFFLIHLWILVSGYLHSNPEAISMQIFPMLLNFLWIAIFVPFLWDPPYVWYTFSIWAGSGLIPLAVYRIYLLVRESAIPSNNHSGDKGASC